MDETFNVRSLHSRKTPQTVSRMKALVQSCIDLCSSVVGSSLAYTYAPTLSRFIEGPHPSGAPFPWGDRNATNCNPYIVDNVPNTGVTRYYAWTVTNTTLAPDGVELPMLVANGAFPGPLIEANWGDWIEVSVTNGLTGEFQEGTSIHW